jgi:hypothetical protein
MAGTGEVLVNFHQLNAAYQQNPEAVDHTVKEEAAKTADSELEQAMLEASFHAALAQLEKNAKTPGVMSTAESRMAAFLQTFIAQQAAAAGKTQPTVAGALEAKFDNNDLLNWIIRSGFVSLFKSLRKFDWVAPPQQPDKLLTRDPKHLHVAVFGDWGTNLYAAPKVGATLKNTAIDLMLHLGDVYYSGEADEVKKRMTDCWPVRDGALNRSLNGNHEMYSGGKAYLRAIQGFGQPSSCFYLENDSWVLVGLDTAYADHAVGWWSDGKLHDDEIAWLNGIVNAADGRKVVLFSHHQPYSILDRQGETLVAQIKPLLEGRKIFAWYWGHEHRCAIYDRHPDWALYGRCVGHSGFPEFRNGLPGTATQPAWVRLAKDGVPGGEILDGPNPFIDDDPSKYVPNGYARLEFDNEHLTEFICDPEGNNIREPFKLA